MGHSRTESPQRGLAGRRGVWHFLPWTIPNGLGGGLHQALEAWRAL